MKINAPPKIRTSPTPSQIARHSSNSYLRYKHSNFFSLLKVVFNNILHTKFCLGLFFQTNSAKVLSSFLQFEAGSNNNTMERRNLVLLSETKLNHLNSKTARVQSFVKKTSMQLSSSLMTIFQNLVSLTKILLFVQVFFS